ncbi:maturase [Perkinsela sp. CCAP 1560/4]|nr:maturase [Perkinsela sp. CCAP 1560/4]|eukprot:KNH08531.1 maturase [Perkinsela sp. CCAP 1560/4]
MKQDFKQFLNDLIGKLIDIVPNHVKEGQSVAILIDGAREHGLERETRALNLRRHDSAEYVSITTAHFGRTICSTNPCINRRYLVTTLMGTEQESVQMPW